MGVNPYIKLSLWVINHPSITGGWIYMTEENAKNKLEYIKKKLITSPPPRGTTVNIEDFTIEEYSTQDEELIDCIYTSKPELFL